MTYPHSILAKISKDEGLLQQLRAGDLSAFETLNLSFDELYVSAQSEEDSWGAGVCAATACGVSCDAVSCTIISTVA